jgi:hypothetical protein
MPRILTKVREEDPYEAIDCFGTSEGCGGDAS